MLGSTLLSDDARETRVGEERKRGECEIVLFFVPFNVPAMDGVRGLNDHKKGGKKKR